MRKISVKNLTSAALVAALYTALTLVAAPISFGPVQIRVSEVLTVLPAAFPPSIVGLSLGCFLSNLIGFIAGLNPLGLIDCLVGTSATLIAALLSHAAGRRLKGFVRGLLAAMAPIVINGLFIGMEIAFVVIGDFSFNTTALSCLYVALGEVLPCAVGAFLFLRNKNSIINKILK